MILSVCLFIAVTLFIIAAIYSLSILLAFGDIIIATLIIIWIIKRIRNSKEGD